MAPGPTGSLQGVWVLPVRKSRLPRRSFSPLRMFLRVASPLMVPERMRTSESWPEKGSARVLKTKPATGASGSGLRSWPRASTKAGRSEAAGSRAWMASSTATPPLFSREEQTSTGQSSPATVPLRRPICRSSRDRLPSSRYFSMSSSSLSAMFSTVRSWSRLTSSATSAGTSHSLTAPSAPKV